jgi:hypothetical protein
LNSMALSTKMQSSQPVSLWICSQLSVIPALLLMLMV